jgi:hypothetical protein
MVWILFMLGTYLNKRDLRKSEGLKTVEGECANDDMTSVELVSMGPKGETAKVEVVLVEEKF